MVVEDDRVVATDIERQLMRIGHTVVAKTARGEDALPLALNKQVDLVLMDIRLEGAMDGIEAAQQIRERCGLPVVFLTAYADDQTVVRASQTEPLGYILKPFEDSQLRTVVEMALFKHGAEQSLRASERRFVTTLSSIGDAVIATDNSARITFMNPVAEALTGWPLQEAAGLLLSEVFRVVNESTRSSVEDPAIKVLRTGTVEGLANHTVLLSRGGKEIPIDDNGSPIVDDHGIVTGAVLVFRDITERRRLEEKLRRVQAELLRAARVASMSELAASIGDEVNPLLTAILTNAEASVLWLSNSPADPTQASGAATRVVEDAHRAGEAIRSMRGTMQRPAPELAPCDINMVIRDTAELLRDDLSRHKVQLETQFARDALWITGDHVQLQQVVLNLMLNAIEAMTAITGRRRVLRVTADIERDGEAVVSVDDTGIGLEASRAERIFDPLFAPLRGGVGVGLSICLNIIEAHGGKVSASPRVPHGCSFRFSLPLAPPLEASKS